MFTAAFNEFLRRKGDTSLHAIPSLDELNNVKLLQVVLKSKPQRMMSWKKYVYRPTEYQLKDMLNENDNILTTSWMGMDENIMNVEPEKPTELGNFVCSTSTVSLKEKIGAEICKILDVKRIPRGSKTLNIKFGRVDKKELKKENLEKAMHYVLMTKCLNMEHDFVKQIRWDKKNSLCLITGMAVLPDGGTIERVTDLGSKAKEAVPVSIPEVPIQSLDPLKVDANAAVKQETGNDITLEKDTAVAYSMHELEIDKNTGTINLGQRVGKTGGGIRECVGNIEGVAGDGDVESQADRVRDFVREAFAHLLILYPKIRSEVNTNLLTLMKDPKDVSYIADVLIDLDEAWKDVDISVSKLAKNVKSPLPVWQEVLELAGLSIEDDKLHTTWYTAPRALMVAAILDSALVLSENGLLDQATSLSASNAENILKVLEYGFNKQPVTDACIVRSVRSEETTRNILEKLDYPCNSMDVIDPPAEVPPSMIELYLLVFALYGK